MADAYDSWAYALAPEIAEQLKKKCGRQKAVGLTSRNVLSPKIPGCELVNEMNDWKGGIAIDLAGDRLVVTAAYP